MTLASFFARFGLVYAVWIALHVYAERRLAVPFAPRSGARRVVRALVVVAAVLPLVAFLLERVQYDAAWRPVLTAAGFLSMGLSASTLLLLLGRDACVLAAHAAGAAARFARRVARRSAPPHAPDPSRRAFLLRTTNAGVLATSSGAFAVGVEGGARRPRLVEVDVPFADLPADLDGLRIAHLSDVHVGPTFDADDLADVVDRVNALDADVVAVTGDLVDGTVARLGPSLASLARLRARHGAYFVTGNHEFYWDADAWCAELARLGLTVLRNEHRVVARGGARLVVGGVDDRSALGRTPRGASDPAAAFAGAPDEGFRVLLAHQPKSVVGGLRAGARLQLSGHTHGGQFFPVTLLIGFFQRYVAGLYRPRDAATGREIALYVSRGTGSWGPPLRLGSPTEIVVVRLRRG